MSTATGVDPFAHPALFYRGEEQYTAGTVPFLLEGLAAGEALAVAVPGPHLDLIRGGLGTGATGVEFLDMTEVGRNPGRIIPGVLRAFADAHPGRRVRIIGEPIWAGRSAEEYPACVQHEALINAAFEGREVTILCPYDADGLAPEVLADAHATHPTSSTPVSGGTATPTIPSASSPATTSPSPTRPGPRPCRSTRGRSRRLVTSPSGRPGDSGSPRTGRRI